MHKTSGPVTPVDDWLCFGDQKGNYQTCLGNNWLGQAETYCQAQVPGPSQVGLVAHPYEVVSGSLVAPPPLKINFGGVNIHMAFPCHLENRAEAMSWMQSNCSPVKSSLNDLK